MKNSCTSLKWALALLVLIAACTALQAQTYKALYNWPEVCNDTGIGPPEVLSQGQDGNFYSTNSCDGTQSNGSVYKMTVAGDVSTIWSFDNTAGAPQGGVSLGLDGNFYGTTVGGGGDAGSVFKVTPTGTFKTLCDFTMSSCGAGADGVAPLFSVFPYQGKDGTFYGVASSGGTHGQGTLFKITSGGKHATLYSFCSQSGCADGTNPNLPLQYVDGNFYGTTHNGGANGNGTVYKVTPAGKLTILYTISSQPNEGSPVGVLVEGTDGNFWGVTNGVPFISNGIVFKISPSGVFTTVHTFAGAPNDGAVPQSGLILGSDGNLYGTTNYGGSANNGAIYRVTPAGHLTILYSFCTSSNNCDGYLPTTPLTQHSNGKFYGNSGGNSDGGGVFYSLNIKLKPLVDLVNWTDPVGKTVDILGQGFTGATSVSFNGVAAKFDNLSDTFMTATVPSGALTGYVTVKTFTATYKSNRVFLVTPQLTNFTKSGIVGSTVTLTGVSLTQTTAVTIGGKAATFKVVSDTELKATVPDLAKTGENIVVTTLGGSASIGPFAIPPFVGTFSPTKGPVGTEVKITGTTFTHASKVTFGGVPATSFEVINDSQVDAIVPKGAKTGHIEVTAPGGTGTSKGIFTVTQ
jgi:uncharacterized repeat protein (TIGR03803 family)